MGAAAVVPRATAGGLSKNTWALKRLFGPVIGVAATNCSEAGISAALKLCRKERFDLADETGPFIDEARIKLQQCGTGFDFFERTLAAIRPFP